MTRKMFNFCKMMLSLIVLFSVLTVYSGAESSKNSFSASNSVYDDSWYEFGIYETELIEDYIQNVREHQRIDDIQVYKNDEQVYEGNVEDGMIVKIFYDAESYVEFLVDSTSQYNIQKSNFNDVRTTMSTNSHGFILPVDNIAVK